MTNSPADRYISRGFWLLTVGVFTSWLFGLGLLFILAAVIYGLIGLAYGRVLRGSVLLVSALVLGFISFHIAAVVGIYTFNRYHGKSQPVTISTAAVMNRK
jgi:hypothetical protein